MRREPLFSTGQNGKRTTAEGAEPMGGREGGWLELQRAVGRNRKREGDRGAPEFNVPSTALGHLKTRERERD